MTKFDTDELKRAYDLLDVPYSASARSIADSYQRMLNRWDPERCESGTEAHADATEMMKRIDAAYAQVADAPLRGYVKDIPLTPEQTKIARAVAYAMSAVHKKAPPWYTKFFGLRGLLRLFAIFAGLFSTVIFLGGMAISGQRGWRCVSDGFGVLVERQVPIAVLILSTFSSISLWLRAITGSRGTDAYRTSEELRDYDWWGEPIHRRNGKRRLTAYTLRGVLAVLLFLLYFLFALWRAKTK